MRISTISEILSDRLADDEGRMRAVFLLGASGVGKSDIVRQCAHSAGVEVRDIRLSQCDPTDLRGVPSVEEVMMDDGKTSERRTVWNPPSNFPEPGTSGILFLDEITSAVPAVQAAAYQLILDRALGDYILPDGWMVVAAGNRQSDRGVTHALAAPLMNRMTVLEVDVVLEDFVSYGAANGLDPRVMAFVSDRADLLHKYDKECFGQQFPSPRSWFALSKNIDSPYDAAVRTALFCADVGKEAGVGFEQFLRVWETMPSINKILTTPEEVDVPSALNLRYCVVMGLAARVNKDSFDIAWQFIERLDSELQTLLVKLAYTRDNELVQAKTFSKWALANKEAFKR